MFMKKWRWHLILILFSAMGAVGMQGAPAHRDGSPYPMEKRVLFAADSAQSWSAAECTIEGATNRIFEGKETLHWHVTVDHFAGEPNYPIGWPRITASIKEALKRDWSEYDFLQFEIFTRTSREKLPLEPAGFSLQGPDREHGFARPLAELKKGAWVEFKIPLSQLPRKDDVRSMQFHISESNYRHLDEVDFYISEVKLLRYAEPVLLNFEAESGALFADAKVVPVRFEVAGVRNRAEVKLECSLRKGGEVLVRKPITVERGAQRVVLELGGKILEPGEYEVVGEIINGSQARRAKVRLVESPWRQQ